MFSLYFDNRQKLLWAMQSESIPRDMQENPAEYACMDDDSIVVQCDRKLPQALARQWKKQGITVKKPPAGCRWRPVRHWKQIIAPEPVADADHYAMVLFRFPRPQDLLVFAAELLRLGCDRQWFSYLQDEHETALLKAVNPPYFSVAQTFHRHDIKAFLPAPAGQESVWLQWGYDHPLCREVRMHENDLALIEADGSWCYMPNGPWQQLYDACDFELPSLHHQLRPIDPPGRLKVRLKLIRQARTAIADLWLLRRQAMQVMEQLVTQLPEKDLQRLTFCVFDQGEHTEVILKARPGPGLPPALEIQAQPCASWMDLENLYLPADAVLDPPLSREKIRSLLAPDSDRITLVTATTDNLPVIESINADAFLPLEQWVDYVIDRDKDKLEPWLASAVFEFDAFESASASEPSPPREQPAPKPRKESRARAGQVAEDTPAQARTPRQSTQPAAGVFTESAAALVLDPSDDQKSLNLLEQAFLESDLAADDPDRLRMWQQIAQINSRLGNHQQAAHAYVRCLWLAPENDAEPDTAALWLQSESALGEVNNALQAQQPEDSDVRRVAAALLAGRLKSHLHETKLWFDKHDHHLDVRSMWLVRLYLARQSGGDSLQLITTRDRILARLFHGMSLDKDVPAFFRFGGNTGDGNSHVFQLRGQLDRIWRFFEQTPGQHSTLEADATLTAAYVRLGVAWGHARLGDNEKANACRDMSAAVLPRDDPIHGYLYDIYHTRIDQALKGLPAETPLPAELVLRPDNMSLLDRYKLDRLHQFSDILEPQQRFSPDKCWVARKSLGQDDPRGPEFTGLRRLPESELQERITSLLRQALSSNDAQEQERLLDGVMDFFPVLGEAFVVPPLQSIIDHIPTLPAQNQAAVLEEALLLAGFFRREDMVRQLLDHLQNLLADISQENLSAIAGPLSQSMRSLQRLNMMNEGVHVLELADKRIKGESPDAIIAKLRLAAGFTGLNRRQQAEALFRQAELVLRKKDLPMEQRLQITRAFGQACGFLPLEDAIKYLFMLIGQLPGITDMFSTNSHFCLSVVHFMESLVAGLASDELMLGELGRKWCEQDEFLVRRRINRDLEKLQT